MKLSFLLLILGIINVGFAGLAGMIDEDKWVKCFMIAAIILIISALIAFTFKI